MVVKFQTFEQYHNKKGVGSTRLRVHNLLKHWPEADLYKYGQKADVMIFQKVYCTYDYKLPAHYPGITILDTCDPDWLQTPDIYVRETVNAVDAVVVTTENMRAFLQQMTDKPVRIIKDRFEMSEFPERKIHKGKAKKAVWFGYSHNAELLKFTIQSLEKRGIELLIISNEDPMAYRWAKNPEEYMKKCQFKKYQQETVYELLQRADVCVLPNGYRPEDKFKSDNKTIIAQLCGLPVVTNSEELKKMFDPDERNKYIDNVYDIIKEEYDVRKSVTEYKELIDEIIRTKTQ